MLLYGFDLNVTKLLANLLTKPSVFYYFCQLYRYVVTIKNIIGINIVILPKLWPFRLSKKQVLLCVALSSHEHGNITMKYVKETKEGKQNKKDYRK